MPLLKRFNPYIFLDKHKHLKTAIIVIFIILSVLMKVMIWLFSLKDWITVPQFEETIVTTSWFETTVKGTKQLHFFKAFFAMDFVWAFLLFFLVGYYVYRKAKKADGTIQWFYWVFLIISGITYILDCAENICYLTTYTYPEIATTKVKAYAITGIYVIVVIMYYSLKDRIALIRDFISSAWISLLFLILIGFTLPKAPQLNSIIVDLYYHPISFVVFLLGLYAPFYCITLSHYPTYFLLSKNSKRTGIKKWRMTNKFWLFGIIWHSSDSKQEKIERGTTYRHESNLSFLRRTIGIFFYMALFYMIAYTTDTNFDTYCINISGTTPFLLALFIWWLYKLQRKKDNWYKYCKKEIIPINYDDNFTPKKPSLHIEIWTFVTLFIIMVVAHMALLGLLLYNAKNPYTYSIVLLSLACIILQTVTYMYYRTFRSVLKYAFFLNTSTIVNSFIIIRDKSDDRAPEDKKDEIREIFKKNKTKKDDEGNDKKRSPLFQLIAKTRIAVFSNNIIFLKVIAYLGIVNFLFLVVINFFPTCALKINSIIILLSYFFLFYGMIVIILKHFLYYKSEVVAFTKKEEELLKETEALEKKGEKVSKEKDEELGNVTDTKIKCAQQHKNFVFAIYMAVLLFIIFNYLARFNESTSNNLYELAQIEETVNNNTALNLSTFAKNLPNKRYYIGCYGGGMKANAWTMTVLNALDKNNTLYDKTACLSGASGGTIGLINYSIIKHNIKNPLNKKKAIRTIGTENILAMDLTHVFGRDLLNHILVPSKKLNGKDRSTGAMKQYAMYADAAYYTNTSNYTFDIHKFNNTSYRQYWQEMYEARKGKSFPILISNTTDIKGRQGMAVSIKTKNNTAHDILYAGACDILDLGKKTLSFYNAASTTNRFPLISPAATIQGKGQFNDGGIFENSGLLSALKLYEAINEVDATAHATTTVFINIINDKAAYVKWRIGAVMKHCKGKKMNASNEISAILNSVAATEMFPTYVKDKLKLLDRLNDNVHFKSIYLPHRFYFEDVKAIYGEDIKSLTCVDMIHDIIAKNNTEIRALVKKSSKTDAIVEPEMSRVMAIPAFDFMEQMLEHSSIEKTIKELQ